MIKQPLREYIAVNNNNIREAVANFERSGEFIVKGVLQRADAKNQNGRVYPRRVLEREVEKYITEFVNNNRALGELDHPDHSTVELKNASHIITEMWWEKDEIWGKVKILSTPAGDILKQLFLEGVSLGISSRGVGSIKEVYKEDTTYAAEVQDDFELIAFDFVSNPSTHGAFMKPVNESKSEKNPINIKKINTLISQIICDVTCECDLP